MRVMKLLVSCFAGLSNVFIEPGLHAHPTFYCFEPFLLSSWVFAFFVVLFATLLAGVWWVARMRAEFHDLLDHEHLERVKLEKAIRLKDHRQVFLEQYDNIPAHQGDEEFLQHILDIVEQHLDDNDFSIDYLAHKMAMSRMKLYRKVKALTGETPNSLIRTIRLQRAAQLLATHQYNISEVAYKVGFSDLKYFRERFKEQFGVIPSEYLQTP